ncbi:MAG TPA: plasmid replication protein, CyRepA1 family [Methylobacter sp.]|jgi:hypothetical protein
MLVAINRHWINKPDKSTLAKHNHGFEQLDLSIEQLAKLIQQGFAFCSHFSQRRTEANFIASGFLAVDVDYGLTLDAVQNDAFFKHYAGLLYTTASHSPERHRFRIVFELEQPISYRESMRYALNGLIARFGGDAKCKDACHIFFGSTSSSPLILANKLPKAVVDELIARGRELEHKFASTAEGAPKSAVRSAVTLGADTVVVTARGQHVLLAELQEKTEIYCPKHSDHHPSAFSLRSQGGTAGLHCSACNATYFVDDGTQFSPQTKVDFDYGWKKLLDIGIQEYMDNMDDNGNVDIELLRGVRVFNQRFIPYQETISVATECAVHSVIDQAFEFLPAIKPGIHADCDVTLVKSPKGSGKTEWLKKLVADFKRNQVSVLLIGHRRTLISATASRIGLASYILQSDSASAPIAYRDPSDYYAICVDSLPSKLDARVDKYDVVLIDEVEQVISHLLSETLRENRREAMHVMQYYLQNAKSIYALDADLNKVTFTVLNTMLNDRERYCLPLVNAWQPESGTVRMHKSKDQLIGALYASLEQGQRCFVCSNSKRTIDALSNEIKKRALRDIRVIAVTSDNSQHPEVQAFIGDIANKALEYDAIFASPTMGTGVDITFADNQSLVDAVFGIFEAKVNTHFDIDQQLCRVRNPKRIEVWVTPEVFNFETDAEAIKAEMRSLDGEHRVFLRIDPDGTKRYLEDPLYDEVFATVTAWQRASKNQLRKHFIELRQSNGWTVEFIDPDKSLQQVGKEIREKGQADERQDRFERILEAECLSAAEYQKILAKNDSGQIDDAAVFKLRRFELEMFYRQSATMDLLVLDSDGKFRHQVRLFETVTFRDDSDLIEYDSHDKKLYAADRANHFIKKQLLVELLSASGLYVDGMFNTTLKFDKSALSAFAVKCKQKKGKLECLFNLPVRSDLAKNPTQQLNAVLNLIGLKVKRCKVQQINGKKQYVYGLDAEQLSALQEIAEHRRQTPAKAWTEHRDQELARDTGRKPFVGERLKSSDPVDCARG